MMARQSSGVCANGPRLIGPAGAASAGADVVGADSAFAGLATGADGAALASEASVARGPASLVATAAEAGVVLRVDVAAAPDGASEELGEEAPADCSTIGEAAGAAGASDVIGADGEVAVATAAARSGARSAFETTIARVPAMTAKTARPATVNAICRDGLAPAFEDADEGLVLGIEFTLLVDACDGACKWHRFRCRGVMAEIRRDE